MCPLPPALSQILHTPPGVPRSVHMSLLMLQNEETGWRDTEEEEVMRRRAGGGGISPPGLSNYL